jgi:hypothetical protein
MKPVTDMRQAPLPFRCKKRPVTTKAAGSIATEKKSNKRPRPLDTSEGARGCSVSTLFVDLISHRRGKRNTWVALEASAKSDVADICTGYDKEKYTSMTTDTVRNKVYARAIKEASAPGTQRKLCVDVGCGASACLTKMGIEWFDDSVGIEVNPLSAKWARKVFLFLLCRVLLFVCLDLSPSYFQVLMDCAASRTWEVCSYIIAHSTKTNQNASSSYDMPTRSLGFVWFVK